MDQPFIDLLEEIRNGRILNVTHGNLRGPDMLVHDHDEGILLKEDSWSVIQELGNVVGLDILAIFMGKFSMFVKTNNFLHKPN